MVLYPLSFILLLTPLVFVHEFGHFLFAKLFGVRVDVFSIGFGPKIFKKTRGETEYAFSAVPLGGYVKLYGQDPTEEVLPETKHRSFMSKEPWQRFLILLGGPLFNFLFAIMVFAILLMVGEPHLTPKIARVAPGTQAFVAGLRSGDAVTSINGTSVTKFDDVANTIADSANRELLIRVKRENDFSEVRVTPQAAPGYSVYGEPIVVGDVDGLYSVGRYPVIGVSDSQTPAAKAGIKTGDVIASYNGRPVQSFEDIEKFEAAAMRDPAVTDIKLGVESHDAPFWTRDPSSDQPLHAAPKADKEVVLKKDSFARLGIVSSELFIAGVLPDSPAQKSGIQVGDHILALNGKPLHSFFNLRQEIQAIGESGALVKVTLRRSGKVEELVMSPAATESKDHNGKLSKAFTVGIYPMLVSAEPETFLERTFNPIHLTVGAWSRALDLSAKTFISIKKLFFRQVSVGTLGGPLLIGKLAGDSISRGFSSFLKVMALISVSLAIFNILPVPVLDGGHIFLLFIEKLRGRPMGLKQTEFVQQIGLSLIMLLLVVVLFNDFSKVAVPAIQNAFR